MIDNHYILPVSAVVTSMISALPGFVMALLAWRSSQNNGSNLRNVTNSVDLIGLAINGRTEILLRKVSDLEVIVKANDSEIAELKLEISQLKWILYDRYGKMLSDSQDAGR